MIILAIDTSETHCSAAILGPDGLCAARSEDLGRGHAERLLPMINEVLAACLLEFSDIDRIAVITGPGTFTGLRIGLSVARGLAVALAIPCVGVSSLLALAAAQYYQGYEGTLHATVKGRGGQLFHQSFTGLLPGGLPLALGAPRNEDVEVFLAEAGFSSGAFFGSGVALIEPLLPEGARATLAAVPVDIVMLARVAEGLDPAHYPAEPSYLRAADAIKAKPVFTLEVSRDFDT